jgi:hypothetical protein
MTLSINDTQHNGTQHNDTQHNDTQCHYGECRILFIIMLNVVMLNVVMLNVVMLNVIMLNVVMLNSVAPISDDQTGPVHHITLNQQGMLRSQDTSGCLKLLTRLSLIISTLRTTLAIKCCAECHVSLHEN